MEAALEVVVLAVGVLAVGAGNERVEEGEELEDTTGVW